MRLPFPTRISVPKTLIFATVVLVAQLLEKTDPIFAALFFVYLILSVLAFNLGGGFSRASGSYVFWFALLTCILGGIWKIILGEPGDSNLTAPSVTLATYVVSMAMIIASLYVSHKITRNARGLSAFLHADNVNLGLASLGCVLADLFAFYSLHFLPGGSGTINSVIVQENVFLPLAILLGTVYTIRRSGGRRSVNVVTALASVMMFTFGLISYSKQALLTFFVCWLVAAASQRYRLGPVQILLVAGFSVYAVMILSPLSQVGRAIVPDDANRWQRLELSIDLLSHPLRLRATYEGMSGAGEPGQILPVYAQSYFDTPQGLLDRLTMIKSDDRLVNYTLQGHTDGYQRFIYYFINWIPHFILPNKESFAPPGGAGAGNFYAHETGGFLAPDDFSTGISFSPTAEAFHMEGWLGIFLLGPIAWILLFTTVDLICGDLRRSPFGLIAAVAFAHVAPESLLSGLIQFVWTGNIAIIIAICFCAYFAPVLGALLAGSSDSPRPSSAASTLATTSGS
jgi:hypothetical protein